MPGTELVIFDNDGVVVDSEVLANRVLSDLLTELGHPTDFEECVRTYLGGTLESVRADVRARSGRDLPAEFDDLYHRRLYAAYASDLTAVAGIRSVLEGLDLPFCLASSGGLDRIGRSLALVDLAGYFEDRLFSAEQVAAGKPAPDLFLYAASAMGAHPSACVVIEDSPNGVAAARAAGMRVFGYAGLTPAERLQDADLIFTGMDELLVLLR